MKSLMTIGSNYRRDPPMAPPLRTIVPSPAPKVAARDNNFLTKHHLTVVGNLKIYTLSIGFSFFRSARKIVEID